MGSCVGALSQKTPIGTAGEKNLKIWRNQAFSRLFFCLVSPFPKNYKNEGDFDQKIAFLTRASPGMAWAHRPPPWWELERKFFSWEGKIECFQQTYLEIRPALASKIRNWSLWHIFAKIAPAASTVTTGENFKNLGGVDQKNCISKSIGKIYVFTLVWLLNAVCALLSVYLSIDSNFF